MQIVVWIIMILLVIFLIWLLRKWIRRLIFILILLALAFLIYGIFNPSGAAKLWYNVRTFPQRVASWMSTGTEFLDYDSYKSKITSIGDEIGDKLDIGDDIDDIEDIDLDFESDEDFDEDFDEDITVEDEDNIEVEKISKKKDERVIKSFPKSIKFVEFSELNIGDEEESEIDGYLTGYSKSDLLGVITKYIEKNLDDDTDIVVSVEYSDDDEDRERVILEPRVKLSGNGHSVYFAGDVNDEFFEEYRGEDESNKVSIDDAKVEKSKNQKNDVKPVQKKSSSKLTQEDQKEAEEIFSILF